MPKINKEDYYQLLWDKKANIGLKELDTKKKQFIEDTKKYIDTELCKRLKNNYCHVGDIEHETILKELLQEVKK